VRLQAKVNDLSAQNCILESEVEELKAIVERLKIENESLKHDAADLENKMHAMETDSMNYALIKQYERIKHQLSRYVNDITDICEVKSFCRDPSKQRIHQQIFGDRRDIWKYYNELRLQRNRLCHEYEKLHRPHFQRRRT